MEQRRTIGIDLIVVVLACAVTAFVILVPASRVALESETAGAILITARGMAELVAAFLIGGRFRRTAARSDAFAAAGLGVMAVADLAFTLGRATVAPDAISTAPVLPYQLVGAGMLAAAALGPERALVKRPRRRLVVGATAAPALLVLALQETHVVPRGCRPAVRSRSRSWFSDWWRSGCWRRRRPASRVAAHPRPIRCGHG